MTVYMETPDPFESWLLGQNIYKPNIDQVNKYFIVSLSGGKDSTALLLKMLEFNVWIDEVVYVDVGKEMPEMKKHIAKLKKEVTSRGIKFTQLEPEKSFDYWLGDHIKTRGKNKGKRGYGWPDFLNRWCTKQLKIQTLKRYYRDVIEEEHDSVEFVGFASDEIERADKNNDGRLKEYPLINFDMTEEEALQYCYKKGYDWGGLYEKFNRVSCYLCPLSRLGELKNIFENYPHLWLEMRVLDDKSWRDFRSDYTLRELEIKFIQEFYEDFFREEEKMEQLQFDFRA